MVSLPPVGGLIPTRDESSEGGVVCELQELDGLVTGGAAVGVQGEEQRGKNAALRGTSADGPGVRELEMVDGVTGDGVRTVPLSFKETVENIQVVGQMQVIDGVGGFRLAVGYLSESVPEGARVS